MNTSDLVLPSSSNESPESNRIIKLNIGGISFSAFHKTLVNAKYFSSLLDEESMASKTLVNDEEIFIDRSGDLFRGVLYFLRTAEVFTDDTEELHALQEEAGFYQLKEMVAAIDKIKNLQKNNQQLSVTLKDIDFLQSSDSKSNYLVIEEAKDVATVFQIIGVIQVPNKSERMCYPHSDRNCLACKKTHWKLLLCPTKQRVF